MRLSRFALLRVSETNRSATERRISIRVAGTDEVLSTTYYASERQGASRQPEIRMGRGLIHWVSEGETLWLGTDGSSVFALKSSSPQTNMEEQEQVDDAMERLGRFLDPRRVLARARASDPNPQRRETRSMAFERNPWVRELARLRSGSRCEMPECDYVGFEMEDGRLYIEVHHIESMADEGPDIIENVAALCPNCHARAHYATNRAEIQTQLQSVICCENARLLSEIREE